jgi:hypothetical protein
MLNDFTFWGIHELILRDGINLVRQARTVCPESGIEFTLAE